MDARWTGDGRREARAVDISAPRSLRDQRSHTSELCGIFATPRKSSHRVTLQSGFPAPLANQGRGILAKEMKDSETKDALLRSGDNYEHLAEWVEDGALRRPSKN